MRTWRISAASVVFAVGVLAACGGDDGEASLDDFCDRARQADTAGDALNAAFESGDPEEVERVFDESLADFEAAVDAAPDEIRDVAEEVTETARNLRDRFEDLDWDPSVVLQDAEALEIAGQSEEANSQLDAFLERECGIPADTEAPAATDPPGTAASGTAAPGGAVEGALLEEMTNQLVQLGLSEEQANCLGQSLLDSLGIDGLAGLADLTEFDLSSPEGRAFIDALAECDIDPTVLAGGS